MNQDVYKVAIAHYGIDNQLNVAVEEMSELTKEIIKSKRGYDNRDHILEELADVSIMLEQLMVIYNLSIKEVIDVRKAKLKRLERRIMND